MPQEGGPGDCHLNCSRGAFSAGHMGGWTYSDWAIFRKLGVDVDSHGKMTDAVIYCQDKGWLFLVEAVTSRGPVNPKRHRELTELFRDTDSGLVYVTAFPTRTEMARYLADISWETEVWVADSPSHLIHFDGDKFIGPQSKRQE